MTDLERFLDRPPSELGGLLLRAGSEEGPSQRSVQRTLAALGVGAAALGAAGSASAMGVGAASGVGMAASGVGAAASGVATSGAKLVGSLGALVLAKWAGVGVASGIAVALAVHGVTRLPQGAPSGAASFAVAPAVPNASRAPNAEVTAPSGASHVAEAESEEAKPPGAAASEAKSARSVTEDELAPLAAEVAFVDRGRAAYQRGELAEAERALGTYEREFAAPRLLPEVLYLRMECASGRGDRARAGQLAERILRQHARSPHAARARAVLSAE